MFQSEQKKGKDTVKNEQGTVNNPLPHIDSLEMIREQHRAMQRNAGIVQDAAPPVQMKEDEEELIQGKVATTQLMVEEEEKKPVQGKADPVQFKEDEEEIQPKKGQQTTDSPTNKSVNSFAHLNMKLQTKMQNSFGTSFQDVNIHQNDSSASQMGALAYTQGNDVHFAPGQFNPETQSGQELLGHELTHVEQQKQGRVQPTKQGKGLNVNDNPALENEADVMGKRASEGKNADVSGDGSGVQRKEDEIKDQELVYGSKVTEDFRKKVIEIANDLGANPNHLMAIMAFESAGTFSPSIKNAAGSGATGLIQFMPSTAKGLGTTTADLAKMTAIEQLDYVQKYFQWKKGKLNSIDDFYMAVLWPKACGKADDYVLFEKGTKAYTQNKGLDTDNDGKITKAEASNKVRQSLAAGEKLKNSIADADKEETSDEASKDEQPKANVIYMYKVEKGFGNSAIAVKFGTTQDAIEAANKELYEQRGGKGYFWPNDTIVIPSPTKNLDKLTPTEDPSAKEKSAENEASGINWGTIAKGALWLASPLLMGIGLIGKSLFGGESEEKQDEDTAQNENKTAATSKDEDTDVLNKDARSNAIKFIKDNKFAYLKGYENWSSGTIDGEKYNSILIVHKTKAEGEGTHLKVYRRFDFKKRYYHFVSKEALTDEQYTNEKKGIADDKGKTVEQLHTDTYCNIATTAIAEYYGATNLQYHKKKESNANAMYNRLDAGFYNTDTHEYKNVEFKQAESYAKSGGFSIAVIKDTIGHIGTLTGGYGGNGKEEIKNLKIFQAGGSFGDMTYSQGFGNKEPKFYIWKKKGSGKNKEKTAEEKKAEEKVIVNNNNNKVQMYSVESGKGNSAIAEMFGTTKEAIESANSELHEKRGGKGYFWPGDLIKIPNATKNLDKLVDGEQSNSQTQIEQTTKPEKEQEAKTKDTSTWKKALKVGLMLNPIVLGYETGKKLLSSLFGSDSKEETSEESNPVLEIDPNAPINESVGEGGANKAADVRVIQKNLVLLGYLDDGQEVANVKLLEDNEVVSELPDTIKAIEHYQEFGLGFGNPDGKVDPNGTTFNNMVSRLTMIKEYSNHNIETSPISSVLSSSEWVSQFPSDPTKNGDGRGLLDSEKSRPDKPNNICCWDAACVMVRQKGGSIQHEVTSRIPSLLQQDSESNNLNKQTELGVKYIDKQLLAGKPVLIGVDDGRVESYNADDTTEHFIAIVGKVVKEGQVYYRYFDPGTSRGELKGYNENNLLYLGEDFSLTGTKPGSTRTYTVSQVRQNS
jgi:hypothetical protein